MEIRWLPETSAFVALDLPQAERAAGICRLAPKILTDGAALLARSITYAFASLEVQASGASFGINAAPAEREATLESFRAAVRDDVAAGRWVLDAGKGVDEADLAALRARDPRPASLWERDGEHLVADLVLADGVVASAVAALGSLDGRHVAVESLTSSAAAVVTRLEQVGAQVVARTVAAGSEALADTVSFEELLATEVDVLFLGSRAGVLDHEQAELVGARLLVPTGPVPITTRAFAVLQKRGVQVLPDFITIAGPLTVVGAPADSDGASLRAGAAVAVGAIVSEVLDHADGPLLGACSRAESFLATWCDDLPFGRPLA